MTQEQNKLHNDGDSVQHGNKPVQGGATRDGLVAGPGGLVNNPQTQLDPQEPNRDAYGDQETGATSGETGDGRSARQVATSGSQATQHSAGGSLQQDSERAARSNGRKSTP